MASWSCVDTVRTTGPVNCLLSATRVQDDAVCLYFGMYAHHSDAHRTGGIGKVSVSNEPQSSVTQLQGEAPLPFGVFDMVWPFDAGHMSSVELSSSSEACTWICGTDGSLKRAVMDPLPSEGDASDGCCSAKIHASYAVDDEMLTSATQCGSGEVVCSSHKGTLSVVKVTEGAGACEVVRKWAGHEFDAWCVERSLQSPSCVWSGGDDGALRLWDVRMATGSDEDNGVAPSPAALMTKRLEAGVTTVVHLDGHAIMVGSYDEHLYLFDTRLMKRAVSEVCSHGGGIWRCRPFRAHSASGDGRQYFAVAAMQAGAMIVERGVDDSLSIVEGPFHTQPMRTVDDGICLKKPSEGVLVYDCVPLGTSAQGQSLRVASCSFYDQEICIWEGTLPE